jgi:DNA-binding response OmpR family regulator
MNSWLSC